MSEPICPVCDCQRHALSILEAFALGLGLGVGVEAQRPMGGLVESLGMCCAPHRVALREALADAVGRIAGIVVPGQDKPS